MIEIDFGEREDREIRREFYQSRGFFSAKLVYIPKEGDLPIFGRNIEDNQRRQRYQFSDYSAIMKPKPIIGAVRNRSAVILEGSPAQKFDEAETKLYLPWIRERNEWVAILHYEWRKNRGAVSDDDHIFGPFALNEECCWKILHAYGIPEGRFALEEIKRMSPERLREFSIS